MAQSARCRLGHHPHSIAVSFDFVSIFSTFDADLRYKIIGIQEYVDDYLNVERSDPLRSMTLCGLGNAGHSPLRSRSDNEDKKRQGNKKLK